MGYYANIVTEIAARLTYHTGAGRMLDGLNFRAVPEVQVDGLKDFPFAMLFLPSLSEQYRPNIIGGGTMRLNVSVSTDRKLGIPALMVWVEKVLDALETEPNAAARVNPNLDGTTKPFTAEMANAFALDLSLTAQLTLTVMPKPMNRGQRRAAG